MSARFGFDRWSVIFLLYKFFCPNYPQRLNTRIAFIHPRLPFLRAMILAFKRYVTFDPNENRFTLINSPKKFCLENPVYRLSVVEQFGAVEINVVKNMNTPLKACVGTLLHRFRVMHGMTF